jgi:hypothetical protein
LWQDLLVLTVDGNPLLLLQSISSLSCLKHAE